MNYGDQEHFRPHQGLLDAYPDQVLQLLEWALAHRDKLRLGSDGRSQQLRNAAQTADLLRHHYVHDAEYGRDAVAAVHAIDPRTQRCSDRAIRDTEEATQHRRTGRGHTTS